MQQYFKDVKFYLNISFNILQHLSYFQFIYYIILELSTHSRAVISILSLLLSFYTTLIWLTLFWKSPSLHILDLGIV